MGGADQHQVSRYIADVLRQLLDMAQKQNLIELTYFLGMALMVADDPSPDRNHPTSDGNDSDLTPGGANPA